jgi:signal transduction histidine kinase
MPATETPPPGLPRPTVKRPWLPPSLRAIAGRGLNMLGVALLVAIFLTLVLGRRFESSLVYSVCISLACWTFIDFGRVLAARWVHRHAPPGTTPPEWPGLGWIVAILALGTLGGVTVGTALADLLYGVRSVGNLAQWRVLGAVLLISLVPGATITYVSWSNGRLQAERARAEAAQRQAAEHQLRLLESQLEPHMLFNTLANLRVLIGLDAVRAQLMLDHLIAFLRATLTASRASEHPLRQEFTRVGDYLALMKIRMGGRLQTELLLPDALAEHPVPPLLLQPLVENAIKHGLEPHVAGGHLRLSAQAMGEQLLLQLHDTGTGLPEHAGADAGSWPGTGFGLQQVRERLATAYGAQASLEIESAPGTDRAGGTLVSVRIPLAHPRAQSSTPAPPARTP